MTPLYNELDLDKILPIESADEEKLVLRGRYYGKHELLGYAALVLGMAGIGLFFVFDKPGLRALGLACLIGCIVCARFGKRWPNPLVTFEKGSRKILVVAGKEEHALDIDSVGLEATAIYARNVTLHVIRIRGRHGKHPFLDIYCHCKETEDLIYPAAVLDAFVRGASRIDDAALARIKPPEAPSTSQIKLALLVALGIAGSACLFFWWASRTR